MHQCIVYEIQEAQLKFSVRHNSCNIYYYNAFYYYVKLCSNCTHKPKGKGVFSAAMPLLRGLIILAL